MPAVLNFGSTFWLWGLLAVPLLGALFLWAERQAARRMLALLPAPRLRAQLTGTASVARRRWRYVFLLLGLAGLLVTLAQPRWGYDFRETHRRGLDVIVLVDVSKSMLATDVAPSRLIRAKLALQDLVTQLNGDRLGLVAFAGTAFLQAPLTIDYDAVLNAADDLDTDLIPMGGTNIGGAIDLALEAFGKAAAGNRAILLLSDGEPTSDTDQADGTKAAGRAAEAGVKVFTMGFGTNEGSLIPLGDPKNGEFVRDLDGNIVRTRLNESGLEEIAKAGNGFYVHFENGGSALRTVVQDGLAQLKTAEIDARTAKRPIERYQWPLGFALLSLSLGTLLGERRKSRAPAAKAPGRVPGRRPVAAAALAYLALVLLGKQTATASAMSSTDAADPAPADALSLYQSGHYDQAYKAFEDLARQHPKVDNLQFDAGASAYMAKQYDQALDAFGKALTSPDPSLQAKSHYNFGNTLFRRGEQQKDQKAKIGDWRDALQHYDTILNALKSQPPHTDDALASNAAYNRKLVQERLDEALKQPPRQQQSKDKQDKQDPQNKQQDQPQNSDQQQQPQQNKSDPKDQQSSSGQSGQPKSGQQDQKDQQNPPDASSQNGSGQPSPSPQPAGGKDKPDQQNSPQNTPPAPSNDPAQPSQSGQAPSPTPAPGQDQPRQRGDFKAQPGKSGDDPQKDAGDKGNQDAQEAPEESGKMSPEQARALLQSLKNEDTPVNLNPDANTRRRDDSVLKDW